MIKGKYKISGSKNLVTIKPKFMVLGLEKFGEKVYNLLVDNFPQTFFVGGMVRDLLLKKPVVDIDMATSALPDQVIGILHKAGIKAGDMYKKFGTVTAKEGNNEIEITTFRRDLAGSNRYHEVKFIKGAKQDSQRRDFTINSLYLSPKYTKISDFNNGLEDIKKHKIKFIGPADKRIRQDPLRIVRALRLAKSLNFKIDEKSYLAIKNNFYLVENLTQTKIEKEIEKVKNLKNKDILKKVINNKKLLDKYFK